MTHRQRGFSLVELMVAMGLSLVLLAGALSILYSSKVTSAENERIARLQESGRTAVELILRDARSSGFQGCARPITPGFYDNVLNNSTTLLWNLQQPMYGFEATGGIWAPAIDAANIPSATAGSDVIVLRTTRQGMPIFRLSAPLLNPTGALQVVGPPAATIAPGATVVIGDCRGAATFAVTAFTPLGGGAATIQHAAGGTPGNVGTTLEHRFDLNAQISPVDTVIYYVRPSTTGNGPALWRRIGGAQPETLIEGVENIQVLYGVDTDGDFLANQYVTANVIDAANNWDNVISLTLSVLVRSETETNLEVDSRVYNLLGTNFGPFNDRRQRSVFTTTVTLRNRTT
jgi:type IV pilus assembly protein PilW